VSEQSLPPHSHPQVSNIQFTGSTRGTSDGLRAVWLKGAASDNLITRFNITANYIRDFEFTSPVVGTAITNGERG